MKQPPLLTYEQLLKRLVTDRDFLSDDLPSIATTLYKARLALQSMHAFLYELGEYASVPRDIDSTLDQAFQNPDVARRVRNFMECALKY